MNNYLLGPLIFELKIIIIINSIASQTSHVFDGISTCRDVAVFQICDIIDPLLKKVI